MSGEAMNQFQAKCIAQLAALEQDMATGEDVEGKPVKNLMSNMPALLTDPAVE
jgi:hypothetical protein